MKLSPTTTNGDKNKEAIDVRSFTTRLNSLKLLS